MKKPIVGATEFLLKKILSAVKNWQKPGFLQNFAKFRAQNCLFLGKKTKSSSATANFFKKQKNRTKVKSCLESFYFFSSYKKVESSQPKDYFFFKCKKVKTFLLNFSFFLFYEKVKSFSRSFAFSKKTKKVKVCKRDFAFFEF